MHISKEVLEKLGVKETKQVETPQTLHEAIQAQKELELGMIKDGINRFHKGINKAKSKVNKKVNPEKLQSPLPSMVNNWLKKD